LDLNIVFSRSFIDQQYTTIHRSSYGNSIIFRWHLLVVELLVQITDNPPLPYYSRPVDYLPLFAKYICFISFAGVIQECGTPPSIKISLQRQLLRVELH
jgi:hypothetical protein